MRRRRDSAPVTVPATKRPRARVVDRPALARRHDNREGAESTEANERGRHVPSTIRHHSRRYEADIDRLHFAELLLRRTDCSPTGCEIGGGEQPMDASASRQLRTFDGVMLVAGDADVHADRRLTISKLRVLRVVGRRSLGSLVEATVLPAVLFYVFYVSVGPTAAMLAALAWTYGSVLRRLLSHQRVSGVLALAVVALTARTIMGIAAGTFIYFMQPIATTIALSVVFFGSLLAGRPIIARMALDFCPLHADVASRPAVARLFRGLTTFWAGVHLLSAAITFTLLITVSTGTFIALKGVVSLLVTSSAIVLTVLWSIRTARAEELMFARLPSGVASPIAIAQQP